MQSSSPAISGPRQTSRAKSRPRFKQFPSRWFCHVVASPTSLSVPSLVSLLIVAMCVLSLNPGGVLCKRKLVPLHLIRQARCFGPDCGKLDGGQSSSSAESRSMPGGMMQLREMQFYTKRTQKLTTKPKASPYRPTRLRTQYGGSPKDHKVFGRLNASQNQERTNVGKFINGQEISAQETEHRNGNLPTQQFEVRQGSIPMEEYPEKEEISDVDVEIPDEEIVTTTTTHSTTHPTIPTLSPFETIKPTKILPKQSGESVTVGRPTSTKARPFVQQAPNLPITDESAPVKHAMQEASQGVDDYDLSYPGPPFNDDFGPKPTSDEDFVQEVERVSSPGADYSAAFTGVNKPNDEEDPGSNDPLADIRNNILQMSVFGLNSGASGSGLFDFDSLTNREGYNSTNPDDTVDELVDPHIPVNQESHVIAPMDQSSPEENLEIQPQEINDEYDITNSINNDTVDKNEVEISDESQNSTESNKIIGLANAKDKYELSGVMQWYYDNMPKDLLSQVEANLPPKRTNTGASTSTSTNDPQGNTLGPIDSSHTGQDEQSIFPTLFGAMSTLSTSSSSNQPQSLEDRITNRDPPLESNSCPSQCMCVCPGNVEPPQKQTSLWNQAPEPVLQASDPTAKINLGISMYPCSRSAAYQLNLALKLCRRKRLLHIEN
ncbi:uncharacterized protein LOC131876945 [Tigriopus californicus]|uniref:uncharacterized protein LOC131876945 n=1 Tax=Tigriopus californicus TaxID=6832 RepID=UPI0027D9FAD2|nr:uncharacterized protein LOC131876945 [Tigriopus californicus]